jgi:hypothetical protein
MPCNAFAAIVAAMASLPPARGRPGRGAEAHAEAAEEPELAAAPAVAADRPGGRTAADPAAGGRTFVAATASWVQESGAR